MQHPEEPEGSSIDQEQTQGKEPTPPLQKKKKKKRIKFLLKSSNFISQILFCWIFKLIYIILKVGDLKNINLCLYKTESCIDSGDLLQKAWDLEVKANGYESASLSRAMWSAFGTRYLIISIWKLLWILFTWSSAYWALKYLISSLETQEDAWICHLYALGLFMTSFLGSLCLHQLVLQSTRIGIQCRGALMVLIYRKSLTLSYIKGGIGDVVNLISNDCNRIAESCVNGHYLWAAFVEYLVIAGLAFQDIGFFAALPALILICFILLPLQYFVAKKASAISYETTSLITKRVRLMSEMLTAIKLIKFYAWEEYFLQKVNAARKTEVEKERQELLSKIAAFMLVFLAPVLAMLSCLVVYRFTTSGVPSASVVFSLLSLFNTLRYPLLLLPSAERTITGAKISISRLQEYCRLDELDVEDNDRRGYDDQDCNNDQLNDQREFVNPPSPSPPHTTSHTTSHPEPNPDPNPQTPYQTNSERLVQDNLKDKYNNKQTLLEIKNADFVWDGDLDHPHIQNLTLNIVKGQIIAIVGDVGSGKSLLAALMGQLKRVKGSSQVFGSFGYVPQEPWLIDGTIKDNIEFGLELDSVKYLDTIRLCGLTRDLMLLSNGDETFINELNLSPSQKQRISLARCICHDPDIVVLEDCFGDFDQVSAKRLFKECIKNELTKNKCIIMTTQQKKLLKEVDCILVVKSGRVVERGTFAELKSRHVNLSAWTSDFVPIEDDPTGLLDRVNEIKLESLPSPYTKMPQNPLYPKGSLGTSISRGTRASPSSFRVSKKPSPLANVINAEEETSLEPHEATIRQIIDLNSGSSQTSLLNEATLSKIIERNQSSVLAGSSSLRVTSSNFANQDIVSRTIEANQLTFQSMASHGLNTITETNLTLDTPSKPFLFNSYILYIKEANFPCLAWTGLFIFMILPAMRLASDVWLMVLVNGTFPLDTCLIGYGVFCGIVFIGVLARGYGFSNAVLNKNISLHNRVLKAVLRAPMSFYEATPLGNILSFFARHLFLIDEFLPEAALQVITFGPIILGSIILVSVVVPWFWATLPLYILFGWILISACTAAQEKLQALESCTKSPLFAHISSTLEGLYSIRLYQVQDRFDAYNSTLIDEDHKALYSLLSIKTFMALYLDILSCVFIYTVALFIVLFKVDPSSAGLALTNALQLVLFVQWLVKMMGELHSSIHSVSLVVYFAKSIPRESRDGDFNKIKPSPSWPNSGEIEFKNITLRYHQYGIAVLKSVSFYIYPGEKVAIVGRSGSGKTTLLNALLRIAEPVEGEMWIDGLNTTTIDLQTLRSKLAVIPQQPVLFSGTIRSNLDPFENMTDDKIWAALKAVHLGEKIMEMPAKLETPVTENGKTFSIAERQLFCIARAVLIDTKIVVFDEPSIAVDNETDDLIRQVIKDNFKDKTVIILANRFRLIVQMDRILVMEHGRVVEYDTPLALLDNPKSKFSLMVSQTGDIDPFQLRSLAHSHMDLRHSTSTQGSSCKVYESKVYDSNTSTRSVDSNVSLPRSLVDIFVNPKDQEMNRCYSSGSSCSSDV